MAIIVCPHHVVAQNPQGPGRVRRVSAGRRAQSSDSPRSWCRSVEEAGQRVVVHAAPLILSHGERDPLASLRSPVPSPPCAPSPRARRLASVRRLATCAPPRQPLSPPTAPPPYAVASCRGRALLVGKRLKCSWNSQTTLCKCQLSFALFSAAGVHQGDGEALPPPPDAAAGAELRFSLDELAWSATPIAPGALVRKYGKRSKLTPMLGV